MLMHSQNREMTNLTHTCKDKLGDGLCLYTHTHTHNPNRAMTSTHTGGQNREISCTCTQREEG